MAEKSSGSLAQQYAQILLGFLTELIIKFQTAKTQKTKTTSASPLIIMPAGFKSVIQRIDSAFGQINLDLEISTEHNLPIVSWVELRKCIDDYIRLHELPYKVRTIRAVIQDLVNLEILTQTNFGRDEKNPLYGVKEEAFAKKSLSKQCLNLNEALDSKLKQVIKSRVAREILLTLAATTVTEDDFKNLHQQYRKNLLFQQFGRGILLATLRSRGIKYEPFMRTIDLLVRQNILTEGCNELTYEVITIHPALRPFSVIRELIRAFNRQPKVDPLIEIENSEKEVTPLGSMVNITDLSGAERNIFFFHGFEYGLQGL